MPRLASLVGLMVVTILAGCAQDPATQSVDPASEAAPGSISGVVVDAAIRPIAETNITLEPSGQTARTDAQGSFAFEGLNPGSYLLQTSAPGFLAAQLPAEVVAGQATQVRITLLAEERTEPFVLTKDFSGFVQLSAGILTPVVDGIARQVGVATCNQCSFQVTPDPGLSRMVLEATWKDSVPDPTGPTQYVWSVTADQGGATAQGTSTAPLYRVLGPLDFSGEDFEFSSSSSYTVRIYPDAGWPAASQSYDAFLSMWYRGPPPDDWKIITS